jgi:hypothetical protein
MPACPHCRTNTTVSRVPTLVVDGLRTTPAKGTTPLQWQGTTYYIPLQTADNAAARLALRLFPTPRMRNPPILDVPMEGARSMDTRMRLHGVMDSDMIKALKIVEPGTRQYEKAMAAAQARQARAAQRWQQACYCGIDDCVFIPGEAATARPEEMESLLY